MKPKKKNAAWQVLIIILPLLIFLGSLPVFFFSFSPGSAEQVEELIEVQGYPPLDEGQFYLTSVMVNDLSTVTLVQATLLEPRRGAQPARTYWVASGATPTTTPARTCSWS